MRERVRKERERTAETFPIEFDSIKLLTLSGLASDMLVNTNILYLIVRHYRCYKSFLYCSAFPLLLTPGAQYKSNALRQLPPHISLHLLLSAIDSFNASHAN